MKNFSKRYIPLILTALAAVVSWVFSIIVISVFRSQDSWENLLSSTVAYTGFWTSPTKFAVIIPLLIALACFFSAAAVQLLLNKEIKKEICERLCNMRLTPRVITYTMLLVLTALFICLECVGISMIYVVWRGQFQSFWNVANVSALLALSTSLLVITAYALAVLVNCQTKKKSE